MTASYKVLAPYVTLKVKDANGQTVVQGYYAEGVVQDPVEGDVLDKHVRTGLVEKVEDSPAPEESAEPDGLAKPHGNAGRDAWVTYALESGQASEDEVKDLSRDELRELYG